MTLHMSGKRYLTVLDDFITERLHLTREILATTLTSRLNCDSPDWTDYYDYNF